MECLWQGIKFMVLAFAAVVCSLAVLLRLLIIAVRHGPSALWSWKPRYQPPPCLQDPQLGNHGYIYLKEVRIHYVCAGSEGKPLMMLVHGFPEFWYSWRYQLKEFQKDYRVVALDMRGYGDSDKPSGMSSYSVDKLVGDLTQLVVALGYEKCVLVGHDWGGKVAWSMAQRHPELVDKFIVLNCPSSLVYKKHFRSSLKQIMMSWYFFFFQMPWLPEFFLSANDYAFFDTYFLQPPYGVRSGLMTEKEVEAYKFTFGRGGFTAPVNYYRQMVRGSNFLRLAEQDKAKVTMPTLIIWGDHDQALETRLADLSSEHSVEGGATVKMVEGASHWVQGDQPEVVNSYIGEFLKKR